MPARRDRADTVEVIYSCTSCGERHRAICAIELRRQPILFGGGSVGTETESPWAGPITCPRTNQSVECHLLVPVADDEYVWHLTVNEVIEPAGASGGAAAVMRIEAAAASPSAASAAEAPDDWISTELADWRKNSVATSRAFSTTMLATSSAAVAIYFSVLKYLGFDTVERSWGWVAIAPPVLFLCAAGAYALALYPALSYVRTEDYALFRARRITQIHMRSTAGTLIYVFGLLFSIVIFFAVLT